MFYTSFFFKIPVELKDEMPSLKYEIVRSQQFSGKRTLLITKKDGTFLEVECSLEQENPEEGTSRIASAQDEALDESKCTKP